MLTEYDQYVLGGSSSLDMDGGGGGGVCSSSTGPVGGQPGQRSDGGGFLEHGASAAWHHQDGAASTGDDGYTLTELSVTGDAGQEQFSPEALLPTLPWGAEPWQQHGPAHAGNPFEDDANAVTASDGGGGGDGSPDRRCVRSLLHVALHRGGSYAQQFTSCGVPPLDQHHHHHQQQQQQQHPQPPPYYPVTVKQEPSVQPLQPVARYPAAVKTEPGLASPSMYVSSSSCASSCSPRPVTPADSLRSCYSPASPYPYPHPYPMPHMQGMDEAVVSTTSPCYSLPPPSYGLSGMNAFRPPYPTPSPDPRPEPSPFHAPVAPLAPLVPLPVHLLNGGGPTTPPATPISRSAKRNRNRSRPTASGAGSTPGATPPPRKRERSERQLHPCSLCDKRFKDNYSVNVHMRTHTGEKPFPCIVCGKMFRQKAHLAKHRSTHQASEWAAASAAQLPAGSPDGSAAGTQGSPLPLGVDGNSNSLPMWPESKCKASNIWTPVVMGMPSLSSVQ